MVGDRFDRCRTTEPEIVGILLQKGSGKEKRTRPQLDIVAQVQQSRKSSKKACYQGFSEKLLSKCLVVELFLYRNREKTDDVVIVSALNRKPMEEIGIPN
uniref:Uncharacterized protein n=1 Tax=Oryza rufipogon TaxID=4529 RepID=A0A0E0NML8_ORYRU